jgi:hypothetical protein
VTFASALIKLGTIANTLERRQVVKECIRVAQVNVSVKDGKVCRLGDLDWDHG